MICTNRCDLVTCHTRLLIASTTIDEDDQEGSSCLGHFSKFSVIYYLFNASLFSASTNHLDSPQPYRHQYQPSRHQYQPSRHQPNCLNAPSPITSISASPLLNSSTSQNIRYSISSLSAPPSRFNTSPSSDPFASGTSVPGSPHIPAPAIFMSSRMQSVLQADALEWVSIHPIHLNTPKTKSIPSHFSASASRPQLSQRQHQCQPPQLSPNHFNTNASLSPSRLNVLIPAPAVSHHLPAPALSIPSTPSPYSSD